MIPPKALPPSGYQPAATHDDASLFRQRMRDRQLQAITLPLPEEVAAVVKDKLSRCCG